MNGAPPTNREAEESVLGALMVNRGVLNAVLVESGLRSAHFYWTSNALIFDAICELHERNEPVDAISVAAQLDGRLQAAGGKKYVSSLPSKVGVVSNAPHWAGLVVTAAEQRAKIEGAHRIIQGIDAGDRAVVQQGLELVNADAITVSEPAEPTEVREELLDYLTAAGEPDILETPWQELNGLLGAGGFLHAEFNLLIGWTNLGKSLALDQLLASWAEAGRSCWLFTTEMSRLERSMRYASARTGIAYGKMIRKELTADELKRITEATDPFPFGIRSAEGWTVDRITQEIAARNVDVAALDPINMLRFEPGTGMSRTAWMDNNLERLKSCATGTNTLVLAVAQLNMTRAKEENPPPPALRDIRDSGTAQFIAHNILSVHREHRAGRPTKNGWLEFLKVRNGVRGSAEIELDPRTLQFIPRKREEKQEILDYTGDRSPAVADPLDPGSYDD